MKSKIFSKSWPASLCSWHTVTLGRLLFRIQHIWNWWMLNFHPPLFFQTPTISWRKYKSLMSIENAKGLLAAFLKKKWNFLPLFFPRGEKSCYPKKKRVHLSLFFCVPKLTMTREVPSTPLFLLVNVRNCLHLKKRRTSSTMTSNCPLLMACNSRRHFCS